MNLLGAHIALCKKQRQKQRLVRRLPKQSIAESVSESGAKSAASVHGCERVTAATCLLFGVAVSSGTFRGALSSCFGAWSSVQRLPASHSWCFALVTPPQLESIPKACCNPR